MRSDFSLNIHFSCLADHEQNWQPYPIDPSLAICDGHRYINTVCVGCYRFMAACPWEDEKASENQQRKREVGEANNVGLHLG